MAGFVRGQLEAGCGEVGYSPSAGASSSSLTRVSISPDFSPVFGVDEEVLHEDLWGGGVRGAVLVVVVFFDVVLLCYCLEDSTDLNGFAVGAGHTV